MTSKTHLAVGCAAALYITSPSDFPELVTCLGISSIGSVISDIDATRSESRKGLGKIIAVTVLGIALIFGADLFFDTSIISGIESNAGIMRLITGFFLLIGICIFGEHQPHRSFMHSIAGVAAVTLAFSVLIPSSVKYMAVSMLSHILIDMLNKKGIRLFYPLRKPMISLDICYADGIINKLLFFAASAAGIVKVALIITHLIHN
ncbi:MAG: metal-dependent hydrolase [Ruminococcus sp.]|nr:metal-dependent hydrolase [Ruminococcus sp.]